MFRRDPEPDTRSALLTIQSTIDGFEIPRYGAHEEWDWAERNPRIKETIFGKRRYVRDTVKLERIFWLACWIMLLTSCVYSIYRMASLPRDSPDFALALILFVNTVFSFEHSWHGVLKQRAPQIAVLCLATVLVWLHILIHFILGVKSPSEMARLIISCVGGLIVVLLGTALIFIYKAGIYFVFHVVLNAHEDKQVPFSRYLLFLEFLKFNAQLSINLMILSVTSRGSLLNTEEKVQIPLGLLIIAAMGVVGYFSISREKWLGVKVFFCLCLVELAYIIYRIVRVSLTETELKDRYLEVCTYIFGPLTAVFLVAVVVTAWIVSKNFGEGLKEILNPEDDD